MCSDVSGTDARPDPSTRGGRTDASVPGTRADTPLSGARPPAPEPSSALPDEVTATGPVTRLAPAGTAGGAGHRQHDGTAWPEARAIAEWAGREGRARLARDAARTPLTASLGLVTAEALTALTDLPPFDTSAMDGWAVAGPGPWRLRDEGVLAGHARPGPLPDAEAVRIATGARVPQGTTAVLRSEHGRVDDQGQLHATKDVTNRQDIRPRGQECRSGEPLLAPGTLVTPAVLGLAAAAGYDTLPTLRRARVDVLVLGDELLAEGLPREGLIRDALGPMLPPWLRALGAEVTGVRRLSDDAEALYDALTASQADLLVTTGGTASGPMDHVHPTLRRMGARLLVDGVDVRPGHPMLLARISDDQHVVGLPGNPLAAVSGLITLAAPLLWGLAGRGAPASCTAVLGDAVQGHPRQTRLVPVVLREGRAVPLHYHGPAMLRGIAAADGLAVIPPGGGEDGQELTVVELPWTASGSGECFT